MFVGLGYSFAAEDKGLNAYLERMQSAIKGIDKGLMSLADKTAPKAEAVVTTSADRMAESTSRAESSASKLNTTLSALALSSMGRLEGAMNRLSAGPTNQLTSALQQQGMEFDKTFAKMASGIGLVGPEYEKARREVFQTSYQLNTDVNQAAEAFITFRKMGVEAADLGLSSFKSLAGFLDVTNISVQDLASSAANLRNSYGFTQEESAAFFDGLIQQSTALGLGSEALGELTGMLGEMDTAFARTLAQEGPDAVNATTNSILRLSGAMVKAVGAEPQKALQMSTRLFSTLAEEAHALPSMAAGLQAEFGSLVQQLGIDLPGGFMQAFDLAQSAPDEFMVTMEGVFTKFREAEKEGVAGAEGALIRLQKAMGPLGSALTFAADSGGKLGAIMGDPEFAKGGIASMEEFTKTARRVNLTFDQQIERSRERFGTTLRKIAKDDIRGFVKFQVSAFDGLGDRLSKLAADDGPIGVITKKLIGLSIVGPGALGPMLEMGTQLAPMVFLLGSMAGPLKFVASGFMGIGKAFAMGGGIVLKGLLGITSLFVGPTAGTVILVIGAIAGSLFLLNKALKGDLGPTLEGFGKQFADFAKNMLAGGTERLLGLAQTLRETDPKEIVDGAVGMVRSVLSGIADFFSDSAITDESSEIGQALMTFTSALGDVIQAGFWLWWGVFKEFWGRIGGRLSSFIMDTDWMATLKALGNSLATASKSAWDYMVPAASALLGSLWSALKNAGSALLGGVAWIGGMIRDLVMAPETIEAITSAGSWLAQKLGDGFMYVGTALVNGFSAGFSAIWTWFESKWPGFTSMVSAGASALVSGLSSAFTMIVPALGLVFDAVSLRLTRMKDTALFVFDALKSAAQSVATAIGGFFSGAWSSLKSIFGGATKLASAIFGAVGAAVPSFSPSSEAQSSAREALVSTRQKLIAQADNQALMALLAREFDGQNGILRELLEAMLSPVAGVTQAQGPVAPRSQSAVVPM